MVFRLPALTLVISQFVQNMELFAAAGECGVAAHPDLAAHSVPDLKDLERFFHTSWPSRVQAPPRAAAAVGKRAASDRRASASACPLWRSVSEARPLSIPRKILHCMYGFVARPKCQARSVTCTAMQARQESTNRQKTASHT